MPELLYDFALDDAALAERFPLRWSSPHKQAIYALAEPAGQPVPPQPLRVRRWKTDRPLSARPLPRAAVHNARGPFAYGPDQVDGRKIWHPNFADYDLFGFWDGPLLAQDELQVLEHPTLARIRLWLRAMDHSTGTVDDDWQPTPITLEGIPRRCALELSPTDRVPLGLYGNRFSRASREDVLAATRVLAPPTLTNLVALAAPSGGRGAYTTSQLDWILAAAFTAFSGVRVSSPGERVTLHTGFWGCGAFGGNRTLMALLQILAAGAAGIEELVFHSFSQPDSRDLADALDLCERLSQRLDDDPSAWIVAIHGLGLQWGVSDGN